MEGEGSSPSPDGPDEWAEICRFKDWFCSRVSCVLSHFGGKAKVRPKGSFREAGHEYRWLEMLIPHNWFIKSYFQYLLMVVM